MKKYETIYTGPIHKLYIDELVMKNGKLDVTATYEEIFEKGNFYQIRGNIFMNMEYGSILPDQWEAESYLCNILNKRKDKIIKLLTSEDIPKEKKDEFIENLREISSCVFVDKCKMVPSFTLNREQFKQYKKDMKIK